MSNTSAAVSVDPAPASGAPMPPGLSPDWQDWLAGQIVRGVTDADLLRTMRERGFDDAYARVTISVVRSMTVRVQQQHPSMLQQYECEAMRLPEGNRVRASDRDIGIRFTLKNPNVALIENILSPQECEKLIQLSATKVKRSEVIEPDGTRQVSAVRTSEGTHFALAENAIVDRLEKRLAALIGKPIDHAEPLQILHYRVGGEYLPHHDYFDPKHDGYAEVLRAGGQRVATLVVYLNDVKGGGETIFPELDLAVKPSAGSAVYFEYCNSQAQLDARLLHGGAPVLEGEKWIATKWVRQSAYVTPPAA